MGGPIDFLCRPISARSVCHSGRAAIAARAGIHNHRQWLWIPGSRASPAPRNDESEFTRVGYNLHCMTESEKLREHSHDVPPMVERESGPSPSAPVVKLREDKAGSSSGMRTRIAVMVGLLVAAALLYVGLFALLHRHHPAVECG